MKSLKRIVCLLAIIGGVQMGCSGTHAVDNQSVNSAEQSVASNPCDTPESFVACMRAGDVENTWNKFDAVVSEVYNKSQFQEMIKQSFDKLGTYESYVRTGYAEIAGNKVYDVVEKYNTGIHVLRLSYNSEGKVNGFYMLDESQALPTPDAISAPDQAISKEIAYRDADAPASTDKYKESIVAVSSVGRCALSGYLTRPRNVENPPVVILVQGSGPHDMDETVGPNKPFKDIAYGLAERGIAVLRYDKRTWVMKTDDDCKPEDLIHFGVREEVLDDVNAAVKLMQEQEDPKVSHEKIFVLGHSLGGMLIPAIAKENPGLAGVISMSGTPDSLLNVMIRQNEKMLQELNGQIPQQQVEKAAKDIALLKSVAKDLQNLPDEQMIGSINAYYFKDLDKYTATNLFSELKMPILLLQGENDVQISVEDFENYKKLLKDNPNVESKLYKETNHLMMPSTNTKLNIVQTEYLQQSHVREEVIEDIAKFVLSH